MTCDVESHARPVEYLSFIKSKKANINVLAFCYIKA